MRLGEDDLWYLAMFYVGPVGPVHGIEKDEGHAVGLTTLLTVHAWINEK